MQEQEGRTKATLELVDRQMMRLSGVNNVDVFDEEKIVLQTELGRLEIKGQHLNVTSLDVEHGSLQVDGVIDSFVYVDTFMSKKAFKRKFGNYVVCMEKSIHRWNKALFRI